MKKKYVQRSRYVGPWPFKILIYRYIYRVIWFLFCEFTPKKLYPWRGFILKIFGAKIGRGCFIDSTARIFYPWNLHMQDFSCVGHSVDIYNLDLVSIGERTVIAQQAYICCGTHDFRSDKFELVTAPITFGADVFVGLRAIILPGVTVEDNCVLGAGAVIRSSISTGQRVTTSDPETARL